MTIDKLPSGSYRIREMRNGTVYKVILDHKPSKVEAKELIEKKVNAYSNSTIFKVAAESYIKSKQNVLSPATIRGYYSLIENMDDKFKNLPLERINLPALQTYINDYSSTRSPKSVRNMNGFIISVLRFYGSDIKTPRLPQKEKKPVYIPSEEEVKRILQEFKGNKYEAFIILATMGLRRSEICALTPEDLNGNVLTINKALVQNEKKEWVVKSTKTESSTRQIVLPDELVKILNERGFYEGNPENLYFALIRKQKKLGIQTFPLHKLRHFFVSYMHNLGYTDKQIQEFAGFKTTETLRNVYQHAMEMDKVKENMAKNIGSLLN